MEATKNYVQELNCHDTSVSIPEQIHNLEINTVSNATFTSKLLDVLLPQKVQADTEKPNQDTKTTENTESTEELCPCFLNSVSSVFSVGATRSYTTNCVDTLPFPFEVILM